MLIHLKFSKHCTIELIKNQALINVPVIIPSSEVYLILQTQMNILISVTLIMILDLKFKVL
jgi:hypothetical protein